MSAEELLMHVSGKTKLAALRQIFLDTEEDALDLQEFVQEMLPFLPPGGDRVALAADLMNLFSDIDLNGDGDLEWDEFTSFCIEAAIASSRRSMAVVPALKFVERPGYRDRTTKGSCVRFVHALPPPREHLVLVLEDNVPLVRLYDAKTLALHMDIDLATAYASGSVAANMSPLCAAMNPESGLLAVAASDHAITTWNAKKEFCFHQSLFTQEPQGCMAFYGTDCLLAASLTSPTVTVFGTRRWEKLRSFAPHMDLVSSLLVLPGQGLLLTGCGDKTVGIFEASSLTKLGSLIGHTRGVRKLLYSTSWRVLLTVSFESSVFGWSLSNKRHIVTLRGHSNTVMDVSEYCLPTTRGGKPNILTLDERGIMKIWSLDSMASGYGTCLFTIEVPTPLGILQASAMAFLPTSRSIIVAREKLHHVVPMPLKDGADPPLIALWNPVILRFITIAGASFRLYDVTGARVETHADTVPSAITAACFDDRTRKLCVGTQSGGVYILSAADGVTMKQADDCHTKEVTSLAYVPVDKVLVSVSWDRQVLFFDEDPASEVPVLRSISQAHDTDTMCVAASRDLSLVATGGADGSIHVWDFQSCDLLSVLLGHGGGISSLAFLDPYPLLASAGQDGHLRVYAVRGVHMAALWQCVLSLPVVPGKQRPTRGRSCMTRRGAVDASGAGMGTGEPAAPLDADAAAALSDAQQRVEAEAHEHDHTLHKLILTNMKAPIGLCSMAYLHYSGSEERTPDVATLPETVSSSPHLFVAVGDEQGFLTVYDILPAIQKNNITQLADAKKFHTRASYDPRRRLIAPGAHAVEAYAKEHGGRAAMVDKALQSRAHTVGNPHVVLFAQWKGHTDHVADVHFVDDPVSILSTSLDGTSRVWYATGGVMGMVCVPKAARMVGAYDHVAWRFRPDLEARQEQSFAAARELLHTIDSEEDEEEDGESTAASTGRVVDIFRGFVDLSRRRTRIDSLLEMCVGIGQELAHENMSVSTARKPQGAAGFDDGSSAPPSVLSEDEGEEFGEVSLVRSTHVSVEEVTRAMESSQRWNAFEEQYTNFTAMRMGAGLKKPAVTVDTSPSHFLASRLGIGTPTSKPSPTAGRVALSPDIHRPRTFARTQVPDLARQLDGVLHSPIRMPVGAGHPCVSHSRPHTADGVGRSFLMPPSPGSSVRMPPLSPTLGGGVALLGTKPRATPLAAVRSKRSAWGSPSPSRTSGSPRSLPSASPRSLRRAPSTVSLKADDFLSRLNAVADGVVAPKSMQQSSMSSTTGFGLSQWESVHAVTDSLKWPSTRKPRGSRRRANSPTNVVHIRLEPSRARLEARRKAQELIQKRAGSGPTFGYYNQPDVRYTLDLFRKFDPRRTLTIDLRDFLQSQSFKDLLVRCPDLSAGLFETAPKRDGRIKAEDFLRTVFPMADDDAQARMIKLLRRLAPSAVTAAAPLTAEHRSNLLQLFKVYDPKYTGLVDIQNVLADMPWDVKDNVSGGDLKRWCLERKVDPDKPVNLDEFCRLFRDVVG